MPPRGPSLALGARLARDADVLAVRRAALWILLASKVLAGWGVDWDIRWHLLIGRDSFWIAPHLLTYGGVSLTVLASFGVLVRETLGPGRGAGGVRLLGLAGTPGWHLAAWGIGLTVLAAPVDDLWHRLFGLDVTLWSPPHLLGLAGSLVNTAGCLVIAREVYAPGRARTAALVLFGAMLYGNLVFVLQPTFRIAYLHGGVGFYSFIILSAALLPLALVTTARLAERRWAPVAVLLLAVGLVGLLGEQVARAGFALLRPVSVIEEEIARDPTSPVAVGNAIIRKDAEAWARGRWVARGLGLVPVVAMALADPRRRPVGATLAYAVALFALVPWLYGSRPSLQAMVPGPAEAGAAFLLTLAAAAAGGWTAARLARALAACSLERRAA